MIVEYKGFIENRLYAHPENIWTLLYSLGIFGMLINCRKSECMGKSVFVQIISSKSLYIYLFHPLILNCLYKGLHIYPDKYGTRILGIVLIWIFSVMCSFLISSVWLCGKEQIKGALFYRRDKEKT